MRNIIRKINIKILLGLIVLGALIFVIFNQADAVGGNLFWNEYKESGTAYNYTTDYDFARKANYDRWYTMNASDLIGNYMRLNYAQRPNGTTADQSHAFCLGHGNTVATALQGGNITSYYKIENIWDTNVDTSLAPGSSKTYNADTGTKTFYAANNGSGEADTVSQALRMWSVVARDTQRSTYRTARYKGRTYQEFINRYKTAFTNQKALSTKIGIAADYDSSQWSGSGAWSYSNATEMWEAASRFNNYEFTTVKDIGEAKEHNNNTYLGPFKVKTSKEGNKEDNYDIITDIEIKSGSTTYTFKGYATSETSTSLENDVANMPNNTNFWIVINEKNIPSNTKINITVTKTLKLLRSRTIFLRHSLKSNSAQNLIIYKADEVTRTANISLNVTTDDIPKGKLYIGKADYYTDGSLNNAEFYVKNTGKGYVKAEQITAGRNGLYKAVGYTSNQSGATVFTTNGGIIIEELDYGDYEITESKAPRKYVMETSSKNVLVQTSLQLSAYYNNTLEYALKIMFEGDMVANDEDRYMQLADIYNKVFGTNLSDTEARELLSPGEQQGVFTGATSGTRGEARKKFILNFIFKYFRNNSKHTIKYEGLEGYTLQDMYDNVNNNTRTKNYFKAVYEKIYGEEMLDSLATVYWYRAQGYGAEVFYNHQNGKLRVYKTSSEDHKVKLGGAIFKVKNIDRIIYNSKRR